MDVFVSVAVFVVVCVAVLLSYVYVLKHRRAEVEAKQAALAAWKKEQSRQRRSASAKVAALRKAGNPTDMAQLQAQSQQESNLGAFNTYNQNGNVAGNGLYGRGDL